MAPYAYPPAGSYHVRAPLPTSNDAVVALVCAVCGSFCAPIAIAGLIFGFKARREIRENPGRVSGDGMALAAIIVSASVLAMAALVVLFYIGIVAFALSGGFPPP